MKLFNFFKRNRARDEPKADLIWTQRFDNYLYGYSSLSENVEFKSAIEKIADLVSNMSIHLMENTEDGNIRKYNELSRLIDISPNTYMTRKNLLFWITQSLLIYGNAILIPSIKNGELVELLPFPFNEVSPIYENGVIAIRCNGRVFKKGEYIHFQINPQPENPFLGSGYNHILKEVVNNLKNANEIKKVYMKGRYMPSVVVRVDSNADELTEEKGKKIIEDMYLKRAETGAPWIIPAESIELQQLRPLTLEDLKLNDAVKLDKTTVATTFGIPLFMLGVGTFNKEEFNNFISSRIMSIAQVIEQTLTRELIDDPKLFFKCNVRSLYSYNITELAQVGTSLFQRGLAIGNEIRGWVGLDPANIEEWKKPVILENYIPLDKIGDQNKLQGGENIGKENE